MKLHERLQTKGWSDNEISHAMAVFDRAKQKKSLLLNFLEYATFWASLAIAISGNFLISLVIIPLLLALNGLCLHASIIILGLSFGMLFELLVRSITSLKKHHHAYLSFLIPLIAIVNVFLIVMFAEVIALPFGIMVLENPLIISLEYTLSFILPYLFYQLFVMR